MDTVRRKVFVISKNGMVALMKLTEKEIEDYEQKGYRVEEVDEVKVEEKTDAG